MDLSEGGPINNGQAIHLEGHDADDLRRILAALEEELGSRHQNDAGVIFSILADLPAPLGVWQRPKAPPVEPYTSEGLAVRPIGFKGGAGEVSFGEGRLR